MIGLGEVGRKEESFTTLPSGHLLYHSEANNGQAGVGFLINKKWKDNTETLKAGYETIAKQLAKLYTKCITERRIPKTWKEANMVNFLKKGNITDIKNYRPICLLSNMYKLFTKIITTRLEKELDENQPREQAGFRSKYSLQPQGKEPGQRDTTRNRGRLGGIRQTPGYLQKQPCHLPEKTCVQLMCAASYDIWCRDMDIDQTSTEQTCGRTKMERSMLNITYKDRRNNIWDRERTKLIDITYTVRKMKWSWAGHINSLKDDRWRRHAEAFAQPRDTTAA